MRLLLSYAWNTVVCALAYTTGSALGAALVAVLGAALPAMPPGTDPARLMRAAFLASLTLGASLGPLASGLRAGYLARFVFLGLFSYVCLGANTALEAAIFTTMGGAKGIVVLFLPATLACAAAAAALFHPGTTPERSAACWSRFKSQFGPSSWTWRLGAAVVAFPVVYLAFGMVVEPFVVDSYRTGAFGLTLPGWGQILPTQLLRSVMFLIASVPLIALWGGSRLCLGLSLGLANFTLVGLFGMLQAFWLPIPMRLIHGAELVADSFIYAALLVLLLVRRTSTPRPGPVTAALCAAARQQPESSRADPDPDVSGHSQSRKEWPTAPSPPPADPQLPRARSVSSPRPTAVGIGADPRPSAPRARSAKRVSPC